MTVTRNIGKRSASVALILMVIFSLCSMTVFAAPTPWDGESATAFAEGDGSKESPYQIATAAQFSYFADCIAGESAADYTEKNYVLTGDIDLSGHNWEPIGKSLNSDYAEGRYFQGDFDGQGHTITYELTKDVADGGNFEGCGLFGFAEGNFSNLNIAGSMIIDVYIEASWYGGLAGLMAGNITNCTSEVDITLTENSSTNAINIGGITGEFQEGNLSNSLYTGSLTSTQESQSGDLYFGGISGTLFNGTISACKNEAAINVPFGCTGGIAGMIYTSGVPVTSVVSDCYNRGAIDTPNAAGGIVGEVSAVLFEPGDAIAKVSNCYSIGAISQGRLTGAVCAAKSAYPTNDDVSDTTATATIENCYYTSSVGITDQFAAQKTEIEIYPLLTKDAPDSPWVKDSNENARLYWEFADYAKVDAAIAKIPTDLSLYTNESVKDLNDAKNAVVKGKDRKEQATVDNYATVIENAIANLVYKPADYTKVDAAIGKIPADLSLYTEATAKAVTDAKATVVRDKNITEQEAVDGYAKAIEDALKDLSVVNPFKDVKKTDWFYKDVMFIYEKGLMVGTADKEFSPNALLTRGMVATILWRMEGSPEVTKGSDFTDIAKDAWYEKAVAWAASKGIVEGYSGEIFAPERKITREESSAMLCRYAKEKGADITKKGDLSQFKDSDKVSAWAKSDLEWAIGFGLIVGKENNILDPLGMATRAEFAAMLYRFIK